ncbi:hypothetical protein OEZ85_001294 [Tetradesmus obliquus]|uniref:J domain-containing protein n=1 Tax=Tetradesmus obliquus TaxID=3088 RepID=A0ABY8URI8_TETOB|nr:hypothetical protein OEZ85_001294 [Tetradesmus obliquus]
MLEAADAVAAFTAYHSKSWSWYQSKQRPALAKPFRESYLPFWVGSGSVTVEVRGAEVGHQHLVTRTDARTGKPSTQWETVWSRVQVRLAWERLLQPEEENMFTYVRLAWERLLQPEEEDMQIYASWKYFRRDVQALAPKECVKLAQPITRDMLQSSAESGLGARRVGPFTLEPVRARRLLMATIESKERRRAEEEIGKLLGASQVRFVDMQCTWHGSTGTAPGGWGPSGAAAAAAGRGGLDVMPVYVPAYVFSWWHGGTKVRTFVSAVNLAVSGVHVMDDTKIATVAAAATTSIGLLFGALLPLLFWGGLAVPFSAAGLVTRFWCKAYSCIGLLFGAPLPLLFWGGLAVPFIAAGLVARFWPLLRTMWLDVLERTRHRHKFWSTEQHGDYCEADWNAAFVHSFDRYEAQQQHAEQRSSYWQAHKPWGGADPFADFQDMWKDPFSWFERMYARQQQQQQGADQQQQQRGSSRGAEWEQQYKAHRQQARYERSGSASGFRSSRDPKGYYKTLGVEPGSTTGEVQAAFRGLALQHHPDRYSSAEDKAAATRRFQHITEAYQVLRDPRRRSQYDSGMA